MALFPRLQIQGRKSEVWKGTHLALKQIFQTRRFFGYSRSLENLENIFLIPDKSQLVYSCSGYSPHGRSLECRQECDCLVNDRSTLGPACQATVIQFF